MRARRAIPALALLIGTTSLPGRAQEVSARVEPRLVSVGGLAELIVEVDPGSVTGAVGEPVLPELPREIAVVARARESRVAMNGLDVERRTVFRYTLRGIEAGTARIDPITVRAGEKTRRTEPLVLLVVGDAPRGAGGGAADRSPPIFVSARVDRPRAWIGQQVTLTFSFYHDPTSPLAESPDYDPPETPGFWRVELSDEPEISSERIGDRMYQVQRFRYALFPLQAGSAEIGPARVRVVQPDAERWWEPGSSRVLQTDPLNVLVDELPAGAPQGFAGAVGRYSLSGRLPARSVASGSPVELAVTVRGSGNPATVGAPQLPDWPTIDVGSPSVETESEADGTRLGGMSTFRWILVPRGEGSLDLGSAKLPYFDPDRGAYVVDTLRLGELSVLPGSEPEASPLARRPEPTLWKPRVPRGPRIRGIATAPFYWVALAGPWLAWLGLAAWRRRGRERRLPRDEGLVLVDSARRAVVERGPEAAGEAARAIDRALATATGVPVAGLPPLERRGRLARRGVPPQLIDAAEAARSALEDARFGGGETEAATAALERLAKVLAALPRPPRKGAETTTLLLLAALFLGGAGVARAQTASDAGDPLDAWRSGNAAYSSGDYAVAARVFDELSERATDPRLEANRAAALWRSDRRGEALAAYQAALAMAPREAAIRADAGRLWRELGRPHRLDPLTRALGWFRLDELLLGLLAAGSAAFVLTLAGAGPRLRVLRAVAFGLACGLATAAALHAWTIERPDRAIVASGAELLAAPGGEPIAPLAEGAVVRILEREPEGWRIDPADHPAGWVAPDRIVPLH